MQPGLNYLDTDFSKINFTQIKPNSFIYGADINNGRKFSKMDNAGVITVIEAGAGGIAQIIPITFSALYTALSGGFTLIPGQMYLITDSQSIYDQPAFDNTGAPELVVATKTGPIEPLVVQAIGIGAISKNAFSVSHPLHVIEYDPYFIATEYMGAPAKGRITLRIDENNNKADYDHRVILFLRYESAPGSGIFNVVNNNGGATLEVLTFGATAIGNDLGDFAVYHVLGYPFLLSNNVFGNTCSGNKFDDINYNHSFGNSCNGNILSIGCNYINMVTCAGNIFGTACSNIGIGAGSYGNNFDNNAIGLTVGTASTNNKWGDSSTVNIGNNCVGNTFGFTTIGTIGNNNLNFVIGNNSTINAGDGNINISAQASCVLNIGTSNSNFMAGIENIITVNDSNAYLIIGNRNTISLHDNNTYFNVGTGNGITLNDSNDYFIVGIGNTITGTDFNTKNTMKNANALSFTNNLENNNFGNSNLLTLPASTTRNTFLDGNSNATFSAALDNNYFGNGTANGANFAAATHVYNAYQCTLFNNATPANKLSYFSALNVLTVVNVNA